MNRLELDVAEFKKSHERLLEVAKQEIEFVEYNVEEEPGFEEEPDIEKSNDSFDDITHILNEDTVQQTNNSNTSLENNLDSDESIHTPGSFEYSNVEEKYDDEDEENDKSNNDDTNEIVCVEDLRKDVKFVSTKEQKYESFYEISDISDSSSERPKPEYKCFWFGNIFNHRWCSKF